MIVSGVLQTASMDTTALMQKSPDMTTCDVVTSAISVASREGRLTYGLNDCVTALRSSPNDVVACILPVSSSSNDVNRNIQALLIESICLEYDILILKVCTDVCLLITSSTDGMSCTDMKLLDLYQDVWNDHQVFPE
ncbi:unnamed protein product [Candidula unifasciata]|uniref:Ribosomal protein L7Ae/L30e/S12e/Gadd45 domain-containing protein n=1 Tax=Candidula unifasciata TaxID=100452 RepID=A0A8S3Z491_9EUPU|nr:unnamed protein product [Candidula unifasciata]